MLPLSLHWLVLCPPALRQQLRRTVWSSIRCHPWQQQQHCSLTLSQPSGHTAQLSTACSTATSSCSSGGGDVEAAYSQQDKPRSSLRADLGSDSALGTVQGGDTGSSSDPAQRRQSLLAGGKRFYDTVVVQPCVSQAPGQQQLHQPDGAQTTSSNSSAGQGGYQLLLRSYPIKTPAKQVLVLPTLSLALAVAAEWEWLPAGKPVTHKMPLTGLACTALDQPKPADRVIEHLLKYVHTDAACVRYEAGPLEARQRRAFDPLLAKACQELGWQLHTSSSIFGTTQPDATVAAVQRYLQGLGPWRLAAMEQLVTSSKSLVIAAGLMQGWLSVADAVKAARLEEDFQLEDWGMVEAGHDLDIADTNTRIGAPAVFVRLLQGGLLAC